MLVLFYIITNKYDKINYFYCRFPLCGKCLRKEKKYQFEDFIKHILKHMSPIKCDQIHKKEGCRVDLYSNEEAHSHIIYGHEVYLP